VSCTCNGFSQSVSCKFSSRQKAFSTRSAICNHSGTCCSLHVQATAAVVSEKQHRFAMQHSYKSNNSYISQAISLNSHQPRP
jgi:hypothetical protein